MLVLIIVASYHGIAAQSSRSKWSKDTYNLLEQVLFLGDALRALLVFSESP